jgi:glycosyltransferase involved in cell wall biosynthesis
MRTATISGVSVLMPTYNEAGNIEDLIRETAAALDEAGFRRHELIVVDDDSPDGTWEKASAVQGVDGTRIRVIRRSGITAWRRRCGRHPGCASTRSLLVDGL